MANPMYVIAVPPIIRNLTNLRAILVTTAVHAETKKIDPDVLVNARLYPDMFPLSRQIQFATELPKGPVWSHRSMKMLNPPSLNFWHISIRQWHCLNLSRPSRFMVPKIERSHCPCTTKPSLSLVYGICCILSYPMSISLSRPHSRFCGITAWKLGRRIS